MQLHSSHSVSPVMSVVKVSKYVVRKNDRVLIGNSQGQPSTHSEALCTVIDFLRIETFIDIK